MDNNTNSGFSYTYSAKEQTEIKKIREKYEPQTELEDKMARLRRLDASVTKTAQIVALVLGVAGTLILGFGMSLVMTEIGELLALSEGVAMTVGIVVGVLGGIIVSIAYPIYNAIVKAKRKEVAPQILSLTEELMK